MKTKPIIYSIIVLLIFTCTSKKREPGVPPFTPSPSQVASFGNRIDQLVDQLNLTKLSAALVNNRAIIWQRDWGFSDDQQSINYPYQIGTLTHIFIPVVILQLMEDNKLDLNDPVRQYLTDYVGKASIKHVLSHTAAEIPATAFKFNLQEFRNVGGIVKNASGKSLQQLITSDIIEELDLQNSTFNADAQTTESMVTTVADLATFSQAIDDTLFVDDKDLAKYLFRPMYLLTGERTPCSIAWFVQYYRHIKLCWYFSVGNDFSSLLIKEPSRQLTLILLSRSAMMNEPFDLQAGDLLNSPIALLFLKTFFFDVDSLPEINYQAEYDTVKTQLAATKSTDFRDLYLKELLSYMHVYHTAADSVPCMQLTSLYEDLYPDEISLAYLKQKPLAEIRDVHDSYFIQRAFDIPERSTIRIFAVGEKVSGISYSDPWQDDNIEFYFDMNNEKTSGFNSEDDDRQYRIQYNRQEFTGANIPTEGVLFHQYDLSETDYMVEFQFPWKTLGFITPEEGITIGFDVIIGDNDGAAQRHGCMAWHADRNTAYQNTSVYGNLQLQRRSTKGTANDSLVYAGYTASKPTIDGKSDAVWQHALEYPLGKVVEGSFADEKDLSASFRVLWDKTHLYLWVRVTDNVKYSRPHAMYADYGWIENKANGDTVWTMTQENYMHAGGDARNIKIDRKITLNPGNYLLRYISNGSHSYDHWVVERPETSLYGIVVYKEEM
jgi:CubicO group peptidase (beta-lactamase class C family)